MTLPNAFVTRAVTINRHRIKCPVAVVRGLSRPLRAVLVVGFCLAGSCSLLADTYTVTSTLDNGPGTLRQAILDANAHENDFIFVDVIDFNIPGPAPHVIAPTNPLPTITDAVQIDGSGGLAATNGLSVQLDGINAGAGTDGFTFESSGSQVSGLAITRFGGAAVRINGGGLNTVIATILGAALPGTNAAGNGIGVLIEGDSSENLVNANLIAFNTGAGVSVASGEKNTINENFIFSNGALGIDLGDDGVTANDAGDGDSGANTLQNYPVLTSAETDGVNTVIEGSLNSSADTEFLIEFFTNPACDSSGNGEGMESLGAIFQTTDGTGNLLINTNFPTSVAAGQFVTATATALDEFGFPTQTSEFSACAQVAASANHAPVAAYEEYPTLQDTSLHVAAPGVLANDTDADNDPLTAVHITGPVHASSFSLNPDGSFDYTPANGYAGSDFFTYQASDGTGSSLEQTVAILIAASTPTGSNVTVNLTTQILGIELDVTVTFTDVTSAGSTTIGPIDPAGIGQLPPGFDVFNDEVFDIHTTATFDGPITICFSLPGLTDPQLFDLLRVLHEELGVWVDVTVLPGNFDSGTICGEVDSLSPFALTFLQYPPGDVSGDFHVTGADSLLINQVIVGLRSSTNSVFASAGYGNGDINQSHTITGADSLLINQVLVGLRPYVVSKIVPSSRVESSVEVSATIFGIGFPTNGTVTGVTIGPPVNLTLTDVVVTSRETITGTIPSGGGVGTGVVHVVTANTNGVMTFGRFSNQ